MFDVGELKKGLKIEIDGQPFEIVDFEFAKPGKGQAIYRCRIKNMITGGVTDRTYRSGDRVDQPDLQERTMIFSHAEGDQYVFMDEETYEQLHVSAKLLGDKHHFLMENMEVSMLFHNDTPIDITLPYFIEKEVLETEPGFKGNTANNTLKPAKTNTGYQIMVPLFVNQGDWVRIDTRSGEYVERVKK